jgi:hypothetical protein
MLLLLSMSKNRALVKGDREKTAHCEECGEDYTYIVTRQAMGEDKTLFSWTEEASLIKAQREAEKNLQAKLEKENDAAPCPHCGWVQQKMIADVRKQSYLGLKSFGDLALTVTIFGFVIIPFILLVIWIACRESCNPQSMINLLIAGAIIGSIGATPMCFFHGLRYLLNGIWNPNRNL